ncbi:sulfotransferase family 2 domain-containing protein [Bacteroides sp.]
MKTDVPFEPYSPFLQNYFCIIEKYRVAFVVISKNAVTTLKNIAIYAKLGGVPEYENLTHEYIGYTPANGFLIPISEMPAYEAKHGKHLKFAVWRDPMERLVSVYRCFVLQQARRNYFLYLGLYKDNSFERFMQFVEFELQKVDPLYQDEHIRRQSDYYSPEDVDYIVPVEKLDQFLEEHGLPTLEEKSNESFLPFKLENEEYIKQIKEWYKLDYEIKSNY